MITEIRIFRYQSQFSGNMECRGPGGVVLNKGTGTTDLDPGEYLASAEPNAKRFAVDHPKPKSRNTYRFSLDFDDADDPFKLAYAQKFKLVIEGSGPNEDPFKEMLYGIGPTAYSDDPDYIDNVVQGQYDLPNEQYSVKHLDGNWIKLSLDDILVGQLPREGATMYTYYRDLRTKKVMPNIWDKQTAPNISAMALELKEAREQSLLFQQAMEAGIVILGLMLLSLGALKSMGGSRPPSGRPPASGRRWQLARPANSQLARGMVSRIRTAGQRVVVNIGGEGEVPGAINLNVARRLNHPIENFIEDDAANIGEIFENASLDQVTSNQLPPNTLNWGRIIPGVQRTLRPGGRLVIRFRGGGNDGQTIMPLLRQYGFREINDWGGSGALFEAVR